jgi:hypothetical protein
MAVGGVFKLLDGSGVPNVCPWSQCRKVIKRLGYDPDKNYNCAMRRMIESIGRLPSHVVLRYIRMLRLWMKPTLIIVKSLTTLCLRVAARAGLLIPYAHIPCQNIVIQRVFRRILDTYKEDLIYDMGHHVDFTVYGAVLGDPPLLTWLRRGLFIKAHPCPLHQLNIRFRHDIDPPKEIILSCPTGIQAPYYVDVYSDMRPYVSVHQCGYYRCICKKYAETERGTILVDFTPLVKSVIEAETRAQRRAQKRERYINRRR